MKENTTKGQRKTNTLFAREHVLCSMTRCPPPDLLPFPLATVTAAAAAVLLALLAAALLLSSLLSSLLLCCCPPRSPRCCCCCCPPCSPRCCCCCCPPRSPRYCSAAVLLALLAAALRMLLVRDDGAAWVRADLACERLLAAGLLLSALHAQALQLGPLQCLC